MESTSNNASMLGYAVQFIDEDGITHDAGRLVIKEKSGGNAVGGFRYESSFVDSTSMVDLCPFALPRQKASFKIEDRPYCGLPRVFEDSLPDAWGKSLMIRYHRLPKNLQRPQHLLRYLHSPLGALVYRPLPDGRRQPLPVADRSLADAVRDIERLERGEDLQEDLLALLERDGSASGGARPKILHNDAQGNWIVKASSVRDQFGMIAAEAACLDFAAKAGLVVPDRRLEQIAGKPTLFVRRFDRVGDQGRRHVVSMKTLLGVDDNCDGSYEDIAHVLRRISRDPSQDLRQLFSLMLLNIAVGNIDDHLKNVGMTWSKSEGWRLSPVYDVTPAAMANPVGGARFHSLRFLNAEPAELAGAVPDAAGVVMISKALGLSPGDARQSAESVLSALDSFDAVIGDRNIPAADVDLWRPLVNARAEILQQCAKGLTLTPRKRV